MRSSSEEWKCILCEKICFGSVVCPSCEQIQRDIQRATSGSATQRQISFINHLMYGLSTKTTSEIMYSVVPDFSGSIEDLNTSQAAKLIGALLKNAEEVKQ